MSTLDTGDWVIAREGLGGGFFWPRIRPDSLGMITAARGRELRVHFLREQRTCWVQRGQVAPGADATPRRLDRHLHHHVG